MAHWTQVRDRCSLGYLFVNGFRSLYLLKLQLNLVDTLSDDVRYWSEVYAVPSQHTSVTSSDLEVKVTDFEILS